jgi:hypothetical protein
LHKAAVAGRREALRELGLITASGLGVAANRPKVYASHVNATLGGDDLST